MLLKEFALTLFALEVFVGASPTKAAHREGLREIAPQDQISQIQGLLPPEMYFNFTMPTRCLPVVPGLFVVKCVSDAPELPPNTEDCSSIASAMSRLNTSIEMFGGTCLMMTYRSCLMYNCATAVSGKSMNVDTHRWWTELETVRGNCVEGSGRGGCYAGKTENMGREILYIAGIQHIGEALPHWWPEPSVDDKC